MTNNKMEVVVKPLHVARQIAKAIAVGNAEAASQYLAKFEVRKSIEQAAQRNVFELNRAA